MALVVKGELTNRKVFHHTVHMMDAGGKKKLAQLPLPTKMFGGCIYGGDKGGGCVHWNGAERKHSETTGATIVEKHRPSRYAS